MSPLLSIAILLISWVDWYIYGKKGNALLNRSPWLIFWACLEVILGAVMGYGLFSAYNSQDYKQMFVVTVMGVIGCALGCATSGVVKWKNK